MDSMDAYNREKHRRMKVGRKEFVGWTWGGLDDTD